MIVITANVEIGEGMIPEHSVEAEYGDFCVEGSKKTLAHHVPKYVENDPPCVGENEKWVGDLADPREIILISHFDLDTLGGIARLAGLKKTEGCPLGSKSGSRCQDALAMGECHQECMADTHALFWWAAGQIDVLGPHKLGEIRATAEKAALQGFDMGTEAFSTASYFFDCEWEAVEDALHGFWVWSQSHRLMAPKDRAVDCTEFVQEAWRILSLLLVSEDNCQETQELLATGREWAKAQKDLNKKSFRGAEKGVIVRVAKKFVNHLYITPDGWVGKAVVAWNNETKAITVSFDTPPEGVSAREIVQALWGPEAGGHPGIAGSPRGQKMFLEDLETAKKAVQFALLEYLLE